MSIETNGVLLQTLLACLMASHALKIALFEFEHSNNGSSRTIPMPDLRNLGEEKKYAKNRSNTLNTDAVSRQKGRTITNVIDNTTMAT